MRRGKTNVLFGIVRTLIEDVCTTGGGGGGKSFYLAAWHKGDVGGCFLAEESNDEKRMRQCDGAAAVSFTAGRR